MHHLLIPHFVFLFALLWICPVLRAGSLKVELVGDRISLWAEDSCLADLLGDLAQKGVAVFVDPAIDVRISGKVDHEVLEDVLDRMLEGQNYIARWEMIEGPVGEWLRLRELRIFRSGAPQLARAVFRQKTSGLRVTRDSKGHLIVENELLIGMKAGTSQKVFEEILSRMGGVVVESLPAMGIYRVRLPENGSVEALVAEAGLHPRVAAVEPHYVYNPVGTTLLRGDAVPSLGSKGVDAGRSAARGLHPIAVLDTGLSRDLNLGSLVQGRFDATRSVSAQGVFDDGVGHGSQMALIASGLVSPSGSGDDLGHVPVLAIRAFDDDGRATGFSLMQSIDYALQNGSRVLSLSWGSDAGSSFLEGAVRYAVGKGAVVVAAAGNEPTGKAVYPAAYAETIAVAALDGSGERWSQSNYGSFVDVAAPGYAVFPVGNKGDPGGYIGTSISTPYVARWIEGYLAAHPRASVSEVREALGRAVEDAGEPGRDPYYGVGVLRY